jgi:hypothetical protein
VNPHPSHTTLPFALFFSHSMCSSYHDFSFLFTEDSKICTFSLDLTPQLWNLWSTCLPVSQHFKFNMALTERAVPPPPALPHVHTCLLLRSLLLPGWSLGTTGNPRDLLTLPQPINLYILLYPSLHCYHLSSRTLLFFAWDIQWIPNTCQWIF